MLKNIYAFLHLIGFKTYKNEVGSFLVITRETRGIVEKMLMYMNLELREESNYDHYQIISIKRMQNGSTPYIHHSNLELEKLANQDS